jgi:hypothetical protein
MALLIALVTGSILGYVVGKIHKARDRKGPR